MTTTRTVCALAAALLATAASAGVRIESVNRDIATKKEDGKPEVVLVQGGNVRTVSEEHRAMILKGSTMYLIDDEDKTYVEMDKETLAGYAKQASAAMTQMQERLKNMPPEQRAQIEKMMGNMPGLGPKKKSTYTARDTGKGDVAEGRKCRIWNMLKDGKPYEELCVVPYSALPGNEDFAAAFKQLGEAFEGLQDIVPDAAGMAAAYRAVNGYPARVRDIENGKTASDETVLKTWREENIPASMFEIPKGYKKKQLPTMGD